MESRRRNDAVILSGNRELVQSRRCRFSSAGVRKRCSRCSTARRARTYCRVDAGRTVSRRDVTRRPLRPVRAVERIPVSGSARERSVRSSKLRQVRSMYASGTSRRDRLHTFGLIAAAAHEALAKRGNRSLGRTSLGSAPDARAGLTVHPGIASCNDRRNADFSEPGNSANRVT